MTQYHSLAQLRPGPGGNRTIQQFVRFGLVGVCNTVLTLGLIFALKPVLGILVANILGYTAGLLLSFALNRRFTFRARSGRASGMSREFWRFLAVCALAFVANYVVIRLGLFLGVPYPPAQLAGSAVYTLLSFYGLKHHVFGT